MVEKKRLSRNVLANVLQLLASAALLFALYRYINATLGVEQLGVWSVVLATASASRLADMGLSAGVTHFVARYRARGKPGRAVQVIDTAALTLMATVGAVLPLLYPLLAKLLPQLFDAAHVTQAQEILPYALVSFWLTSVAAVFQGGLDGCQRMDLRAGLMVAGQVLLLALALWLVPKFGLVGLAWAQIGQGLFLVVAGRFLLRRTLPQLPWLMWRWRMRVLREMLGYGANVQAAALFMLFFDPVTKALMARFGGAAAAGYFEMANQVVLRVRSLIVAANQAVVPHVATVAVTEPGRLERLYHESMRLLVVVSLPVFALLFAWADGIVWLLVDRYQPELVVSIGILAIAWGSNIFAGPAYFANMGVGRVGWNTVSHLVMGVLNVGLGWLLGKHFGAHGVMSAYVIALIVGSWVLVAVYHRSNGLSWSSVFAREHLWLAFGCVAVAALGWVVPLRPSAGEQFTLAAGLLLPPLVLGLVVWFHPMRKQVLGWLVSR